MKPGSIPKLADREIREEDPVKDLLDKLEAAAKEAIAARDTEYGILFMVEHYQMSSPENILELVKYARRLEDKLSATNIAIAYDAALLAELEGVNNEPRKRT